MPATTDASSPTPRFARPARSLAFAAGTVLLGLAGPAPADPGAPAGTQSERPAGLAGVDAYRLDFLGASGLAPMAAPEAPAAEPPAIRPVATTPLSGLDQQATGDGSYSLSDAVRDAGWRKATGERLRRMAPERPRF